MAKRRRSKARARVSNYKQQCLLSAPKPPPSTQDIIEASGRGQAVSLWLGIKP